MSVGKHSESPENQAQTPTMTMGAPRGAGGDHERQGGTPGGRTMSPDGGAQIGQVEGSMVPDLYTFSYEIQRKHIRNIRISEPERALRSQVGAPGGELFGEIEQRCVSILRKSHSNFIIYFANTF